ncbi:MAG: hypothetical protein BKP49_11140 [Treponema sp. CETP13]|nr:MAG: hypothetical protein BKP49_11140 [Treponema sp. CETP13]
MVVVNLLFLCITSCTTLPKQYDALLIDYDVKHFKYEDSSIKYTETGSGQTILFVHGLGAASFTWRYLYEYYSKNYHVISLDLKGFGDSSKPIDDHYLVSDQAKIIHSFIVNKNLNNVILVANSYGGAVVLTSYLEAKPDIKNSIKKLILLDPAAYFPKKFPGYVALLRTPVLNRMILTFGNKNFLSKFVLKQLFYDKSLITDEMITTYGGFLKGSPVHNALIETAKNIYTPETAALTASYNKITIPVLIIWGKFDTVIDKSIGEELNRNIVNSKLVIIDDCGHAPQEELPDQAIAIINNFL